MYENFKNGRRWSRRGAKTSKFKIKVPYQNVKKFNIAQI